MSILGTVAAAECGNWGNKSEFYLPGMGSNETSDFFREATGSDLQRCLDRGLDPNFIGKSGLTPLFAAIFYTNIHTDQRADMIDVLVDAGADINALGTDNYDRYTPVAWAMTHSGLDVVFQLIELGASLDFAQATGRAAFYYPTGLYTADEYTTGILGNEELLLMMMAVDPDLQVSDTSLRFDERQPLLNYLLESSFNNDFTRAVINAGADPNAPGIQGRTPIHAAANGYSDSALAYLLVEKGADLSVRDERGRTPLHNAATATRRGAVSTLIEIGIDLDARDNFGQTALHLAAGSDIPDRSSVLIDAGADLEAVDNRGWTPIFHVAGKLIGDGRLARLEQEGRWQFHNDARTITGEETISFERFMAARFPDGGFFPGSPTSVSQQHLADMIMAGANRTHRDAEGRTVLDFLNAFIADGAIFIEGTNVHAALTDSCALWQREPKRLINLMFVTIDRAKLQSCMEAGIVTQDSSPGNRPIVSILARTTQDVEVFEYLEGRGIDMLETHRDGDSLLHIHARSQHATPQIANYFLDAGIGIESRNDDGETPLLKASAASVLGAWTPEMIPFLLGRGADATATDSSGNTALHNITRTRLGMENYAMLAEAGTNVNAKNNNGLTPLHNVVRFHDFHNGKTIDFEKLETLLSLGADANLRDNQGRTPLEYARELECAEDDAMALLINATR